MLKRCKGGRVGSGQRIINTLSTAETVRVILLKQLYAVDPRQSAQPILHQLQPDTGRLLVTYSSTVYSII